MWWVIHMCRGFDPLFSLWQDRARSFLGIFLIHQQQSYLLGYKNYQFLQKSIFLAPNSIFPRSFWVQFSAASGTHPSIFRPSTPPRDPDTIRSSDSVAGRTAAVHQLTQNKAHNPFLTTRLLENPFEYIFVEEESNDFIPSCNFYLVSVARWHTHSGSL